MLVFLTVFLYFRVGLFIAEFYSLLLDQDVWYGQLHDFTMALCSWIVFLLSIFVSNVVISFPVYSLKLLNFRACPVFTSAFMYMSF